MAGSESLDWLIQQSKKYPLLTPDQEIHLGRQVQAWLQLKDLPNPTKAQKSAIRRGKRAYDTFYTSNIRLVVVVAKRFHHVQSSFEPEDLVQEGLLGLQRAIVKFDPTRGYKFSTYAFNWVRQSISRGIYDRGRMVRLPSQGAERLRHLLVFCDQYEAEHGRRPTLKLLSEQFNIPVHNLKHYLVHAGPVTSLDEQLRGAGSKQKDATYLDMVADQVADQQMLDGMDNVVHALHHAIEQLQPAQQEVINEIYQDTDKPPSLTQIARSKGVSREAIRCQHMRALNALRVRLCKSLSEHDIDGIRSAA